MTKQQQQSESQIYGDILGNIRGVLSGSNQLDYLGFSGRSRISPKCGVYTKMDTSSLTIPMTVQATLSLDRYDQSDPINSGGLRSFGLNQFPKLVSAVFVFAEIISGNVKLNQFFNFLGDYASQADVGVDVSLYGLSPSKAMISFHSFFRFGTKIIINEPFVLTDGFDTLSKTHRKAANMLTNSMYTAFLSSSFSSDIGVGMEMTATFFDLVKAIK